MPISANSVLSVALRKLCLSDQVTWPESASKGFCIPLFSIPGRFACPKGAPVHLGMEECKGWDVTVRPEYAVSSSDGRRYQNQETAGLALVFTSGMELPT